MVGDEKRRPGRRHMLETEQPDAKILRVKQLKQRCRLFDEMGIVAVIRQVVRRVDAGRAGDSTHRFVNGRQRGPNGAFRRADHSRTSS